MLLRDDGTQLTWRSGLHRWLCECTQPLEEDGTDTDDADWLCNLLRNMLAQYVSEVTRVANPANNGSAEIWRRSAPVGRRGIGRALVQPGKKDLVAW